MVQTLQILAYHLILLFIIKSSGGAGSSGGLKEWLLSIFHSDFSGQTERIAEWGGAQRKAGLKKRELGRKPTEITQTLIHRATNAFLLRSRYKYATDFVKFEENVLALKSRWRAEWSHQVRAKTILCGSELNIVQCQVSVCGFICLLVKYLLDSGWVLMEI